MLSCDTPTGQCTCFLFELCIPYDSGKSNGVPFLHRFLVQFTVLPLQCFEVTYPVWDNIAMCVTATLQHKCESHSLDGATQKSSSATANNDDLLR